jgi:hypothetical protein
MDLNLFLTNGFSALKLKKNDSRTAMFSDLRRVLGGKTCLERGFGA